MHYEELTSPKVDAARDAALRFATELRWPRSDKPLYHFRGDSRILAKTELDGDLLVEGDVGDRCEIHATGDVQVAGGVGEDARITSGRNVSVSGRVRRGAALHASGSLYLRSAVEACLSAISLIRVDEDLLSCDVDTPGTLAAGGRVAGGHIVADSGLYVSVIGAPSHLTTRVVVSPAESRLTRLADLEREVMRLSSTVLAMRKVLGAGGKKGDEAPRFGGAGGRQLERLLAALRERTREALIARALTAVAPSAEVVVDQVVYPGAEICLNGATFKPRMLQPGCRLIEAGGHVLPELA